MQNATSNRTRILAVRLSVNEFDQIQQKWKASTCRKLSDYIRRSIFNRPIVATYRNRSLDDFMTEAIRLRNELNAIGNNINQAVKKLHTLNENDEYFEWRVRYEMDHKNLQMKVEEIKIHIQKMAEKWLQ